MLQPLCLHGTTLRLRILLVTYLNLSMISMCPQYHDFLYMHASITSTRRHVTNVANKPIVSLSVFDMRVNGKFLLHSGA
jgi:hypothetical protein